MNTDKEDVVQIIGFNVGEKLYGADILSIREILRDPVIEPVDKSPDFIEGIVRLRGEVIPIIDLTHRLAGGRLNGANGNKDWVLIAQSGGVTTGYVVDAVTHIHKIGADTILPAPELILAGLRSQYMRGVCDTEKGLLVVLDLDRMLVNDEIHAIRQLELH